MADLLQSVKSDNFDALALTLYARYAAARRRDPRALLSLSLACRGRGAAAATAAAPALAVAIATAPGVECALDRAAAAAATGLAHATLRDDLATARRERQRLGVATQLLVRQGTMPDCNAITTKLEVAALNLRCAPPTLLVAAEPVDRTCAGRPEYLVPSLDELRRKVAAFWDGARGVDAWFLKAEGLEYRGRVVFATSFESTTQPPPRTIHVVAAASTRFPRG